MPTDGNRLSGVFAPIPTPFEDERLRLDWLQENLQRWSRTDLAGYLALGTNGEFKSLSTEEKVEVARVCGREKGDKTLMVGTGCESAVETIELTNRIADVGCDYASILAPHYFASAMDDEAVIGFFREVADAAKIPVVLYNIPIRAAGLKISTAAAESLAEHPNIHGMKDSGGVSVFSFLATAAGPDFAVMAGMAHYFLPSLLLGATGGVISLANCFPEICCELYEETVSENLVKARELHRTVLLANQAVGGTYGPPGVKAAMEMVGYHGGPPRRPLKPMTEAKCRAMREELEKLGFLK